MFIICASWIIASLFIGMELKRSLGLGITFHYAPTETHFIDLLNDLISKRKDNAYIKTSITEEPLDRPI